MPGFVTIPARLRTLDPIPSIKGRKPLPRGTLIGVYAALAGYADNQTGKCWPSIASLAEDTGWSDDTVERAIATLIDAGLMTKSASRRGGMKGPNEYYLTPESPKKQIPPRKATIPPTAGHDTAQEGNRYRPGRQELDSIELEPRELDTPPTPKPKEPSPDDQRFETFWAIYPRKVKKGVARTIWLRLKPEPELVDQMIRAVTAWAKSEDWAKENGRYIPHPSTWLNQERWEDEPPPAVEKRRGADARGGMVYG